MVWASIDQAKNENRHELLISGKELSTNLENSDGKLDENLFKLTQLNFLRLSMSTLTAIPDRIGNLINLTNLELQNNNLCSLPKSLGKLKKLKLLDVSNNKLEEIPVEVNELSSLTSVNIRGNSIKELPTFKTCSYLGHLDARMNQFTDFEPICHDGLIHLGDVLLASNKIEEVPCEISNLTSLKCIDLSDNIIKVIPGDVLDCSKLKEIQLKGNPLTDRRFRKLVEADRSLPRQVIDYLQKNCKRDKKGGDKKKKNKGPVEEPEIDALCNRLNILSAHEDRSIIFGPEVKEVRGFLVCCIIRNLNLSGSKMKTFIAAQTRLHDTECEKRMSATIATHDLSKIAFPLTYTAKSPEAISIHPLNREKPMRAKDFFRSLQKEAESIRKQMKRNTYSGIHKYINLVEGWQKWPVLEDANGTVISFPPITNAESTKISTETTAVLAEVTSSTSLPKAKEVMEALIKCMLECEICSETSERGKSIMEIEQIRVLEQEDRGLRVIFPSRTDLAWDDDDSVEVVRR